MRRFCRATSARQNGDSNRPVNPRVDRSACEVLTNQALRAQPSGPPRPAQPASGGPPARAAQRARRAVSRRATAGHQDRRGPPSTPSLAAIAEAGLRFSNTWAMPACTTSRAVSFDGRFPVRTRVYSALGPPDLANGADESRLDSARAHLSRPRRHPRSGSELSGVDAELHRFRDPERALRFAVGDQQTGRFRNRQAQS